jgi:hypothetical protein
MCKWAGTEQVWVETRFHTKMYFQPIYRINIAGYKNTDS